VIFTRHEPSREKKESERRSQRKKKEEPVAHGPAAQEKGKRGGSLLHEKKGRLAFGAKKKILFF